MQIFIISFPGLRDGSPLACTSRPPPADVPRRAALHVQASEATVGHEVRGPSDLHEGIVVHEHEAVQVTLRVRKYDDHFYRKRDDVRWEGKSFSREQSPNVGVGKVLL